MEKKFQLSVWFPANLYDLLSGRMIETSHKIETLLGPCDGAGTGFGFRDIDWGSLTEERAGLMVAELAELDIPGLCWDVSEEEPEGD